MQEIIDTIAMYVAKGKVNKSAWWPPEMKGQDGADEFAADALTKGIQPSVLLEGCIQGMERVGKEFGEGKAFVTNLIVSGVAMNAVLKHIKPYLESGEVKRKGTFVIGTVTGDMHDIGKNLVSMMIKGGGYEVIDLGVDVATTKFLHAIEQHPGCFVGLSALLTTTMRNMTTSVEAIKKSYPDTKVLIGGAPITQGFCTQIGAHFYSPNPNEAVDFLNKNVM